MPNQPTNNVLLHVVRNKLHLGLFTC